MLEDDDLGLRVPQPAAVSDPRRMRYGSCCALTAVYLLLQALGVA